MESTILPHTCFHAFAVEPDELGAALEAYNNVLPELHTFRLCVAFGNGSITKLSLEIREMIEIALVESEKDLETWTHERECFDGPPDGHEVRHALQHWDLEEVMEGFARNSCLNCKHTASRFVDEEAIQYVGLSIWKCQCIGFLRWFRNFHSDQECQDMVETWVTATIKGTLFESRVLRHFGLALLHPALKLGWQEAGRYVVYLIPKEADPGSTYCDVSDGHVYRAAKQDQIRARFARFMKALSMPLLDPVTYEPYIRARELEMKVIGIVKMPRDLPEDS